MRNAVLLTLCLSALTACAGDGEIAAQMEQQDASKCRELTAAQGMAGDPQAYVQCRQNLLTYRRLAAERRESLGQGLQNAGAALSNIGR